MKKFVCIVLMLAWAKAFAGGAIGGNPGLIREALAPSLVDSSFNVAALPKEFVDASEFRRTQARLSVDGVKTVPMLLNGESIDVRSLRGSVVDANISKELLPSPAQ
jgi:hypothetical protein